MNEKYDVVVIGGGPAGLTAGIYLSRAGMKSLLFETVSPVSQAVLTDKIENYPGFPEGINGFELVENFKKQAANFGLATKTEEAKSIEQSGGNWSVTTESGKYEAAAIIMALGAKPRRLDVPGEESLTGKGVSYCATCDGALFKNADVISVGGGDSALEEALFLTNFCRTVTVVHRRDALRAAKILQDRALSNPKIKFIWDSVVAEILGDGKVESARIKNVKTNKENVVPCAAVFIFVGNIPNTGWLKGVVDLSPDGYIVADDDLNTSRQGIFAAGDCRKKLLRQVVTACADGATAAVSARLYVEKTR